MKMDIRNVLQHIVESMLPRFSGSEKGLYVQLQLQYMSYAKDDHTCNYPVNLLFIRSGNYTKVLSIEGHASIYNPDSEWILQSDHDSCWSSDGFQFLMGIDKEAYEYFEKRGIEPKDVHEHFDFGYGISKLVVIKNYRHDSTKRISTITIADVPKDES